MGGGGYTDCNDYIPDAGSATPSVPCIYLYCRQHPVWHLAHHMHAIHNSVHNNLTLKTIISIF